MAADSSAYREYTHPMRPLFVSLLLLTALFGCATTRPPAPTLEQIIAMHQSGESADKVIARVRESGYVVYRLSNQDIVKLSQAGVPDKVIDYLRQTEMDEVRRQERQYSDGPWAWPRFHIWIQR
jgi:hypothetical protein